MSSGTSLIANDAAATSKHTIEHDRQFARGSLGIERCKS